MMRLKDLAAYLFLAVAWGLSFVVVLRVVLAFGWAGAVAFRALVAGVTLLAAAGVTRRRLNFSAGWGRFVVVGATTVAGQLVGQAFAMPRIGTAMAAIFVAAIPLFSMVISQAWGLERATLRSGAGLVLGFGGIVLLVGFPAAPMTGPFLLGCAAALGAALAAAFGSNYASCHLHDAGSWEVTIGAFLSGGAMALPLLLAVPVPMAPRLADYGCLLLAGGVMSALTYVIYFRLVAVIGATRAISVEFAVTVIAVTVGAFGLGERLSAVQVVGAAVILCGCALVLGLVPGGRRSAAAKAPAQV